MPDMTAICLSSCDARTRSLSGSFSRAPAPVADLRHVVAMLADVKLMPFHRGPVPRCRLFNLVAQSWNAPDGVECELKAVEIVEHDHVEGRRGGAFVPETADVNIVVVVPPVC